MPRQIWQRGLSAAKRWLRPDSQKRLRVGRVVAALLLVVVTTPVLLGVFVLLPSLYLDRRNLPDIGPLLRFEFPAVGTIYDANNKALAELAVEKRLNTQYNDIPPIVRDAVIAAEDKRFFSHNGVDYYSLPRVISKIRFNDDAEMFPQGGSTITQQLVRGVFLQQQTALENSDRLQSRAFTPRLLAKVLGARQVNRFLRKHEEMRLSLWLERKMQEQFGSKLAAKREILARYASFVYMGHSQYGFAKASEYYFGKPLSSFTPDDADKAAILAGIMKAPRDYAPATDDVTPVLRRRNEILALMARRGFISNDEMKKCREKPVITVKERPVRPVNSAAIVQHILDDFEATHPELNIEDLMQGRIQVYTTVDTRIQQIAGEALERGLAAYEKRHPKAKGLIQGALVVLKNSDGSVLAEIGGRQVFSGKPANYLDFNRVTESQRQPGSAMKPIVYLAAFRRGDINLDTMVPDEPINVPDTRGAKAISNYDGQFKGMIPVRKAFAESRNTVAVWLASQVGIDSVLMTARSLGVHSELKRYLTTALGASEMSLLDLATAYRTIASGLVVEPHVIRQVIDRSGDTIGGYRPLSAERMPVNDVGLQLVQEGLRGVVRMPSGTAHGLTKSKSFPIEVMGKTGTTSDFKDAVFVGSTYGLGGVTVAVRIGFDDNRTLGGRETGGLVAMPVFRDVMGRIYRENLVGPAPEFPKYMEDNITEYLKTSAMLAALPKPTFWFYIGR